MGYSIKMKRQDDFYKQYTIDQLIKQVMIDLPNIERYNQQQYEEWFSHIYPIEELVNKASYTAYTAWIINQGKPLKQRLEQWLNYVTTE